jgi:hypothetical protein
LLRGTLRGDATCEVVNARLTLLWISVFVLLSDGSIPTRQRSAMRDRDFAEMATAFEMAVGRLGLGERECPVDHRAQAVQSDGPVHRLKVGAAPDADRPDGNAAASLQ